MLFISIAVAMLFIFRTYTSSNIHPGGPSYKNGYIFLSITAHHTESGDMELYMLLCTDLSSMNLTCNCSESLKK